MAVLRSIQGHNNTVVHSFNHTEGRCPMCGCPNQAFAFCSPNETDAPKVRGCELDGRHLHRVCMQCRYPFVERTLEHAMLAEEEGEFPAESELAAFLAVIVERAGGVQIDSAMVLSRRGYLLRFKRDAEARLVTVSATPPEKQGKPAHPSLADLAPGGEE